MSGGNGHTTLRQVAAAAHAAEAKRLGVIIRDLRNIYGADRPQMAKEIGCSLASLGDTERGRIRVKVLRLLAEHPAFERLPDRCRQAGINLLDWTCSKYGSSDPAGGDDGGDDGGGIGGGGIGGGDGEPGKGRVP